MKRNQNPEKRLELVLMASYLAVEGIGFAGYVCSNIRAYFSALRNPIKEGSKRVFASEGFDVIEKEREKYIVLPMPERDGSAGARVVGKLLKEGKVYEPSSYQDCSDAIGGRMLFPGGIERYFDIEVKHENC